MIECGIKLSESFLTAGLIDKMYSFFGAKILGGRHALFPNINISNIDKAIHMRDIRAKVFDDNILITGYPVYT